MRAHDAKPRTAPMARRRDGDIAPYRQAARGGRTATGRGRGGRREPGVPAADHRALPQRGTGDARNHGRYGGGRREEDGVADIAPCVMRIRIWGGDSI